MESQLNLTVGYVPAGYAEGQCGRCGERTALSLSQLGTEYFSCHFTKLKHSQSIELP
jgi:hypothetical protein